MNWRRLALSLGIVLGAIGLLTVMVMGMRWCARRWGPQYAGIAVQVLVTAWLTHMVYLALEARGR